MDVDIALVAARYFECPPCQEGSRVMPLAGAHTQTDGKRVLAVVRCAYGGLRYYTCIVSLQHSYKR